MPSAALPHFLEPGDPVEIRDRLVKAFTGYAGRTPAVVAVAPGRVNVIGEHLDYNGGRCLPLALPHATYAAAAAREDGLLRIRSVQMADTVELPVEELRPEAVTGWAAYVAGVVWALHERWPVPGLDLLVDGHVPVGAGLSSSAALECAVAIAVGDLLSLPDSGDLRRELVACCVRAETEMAGAPTGGMDQTVALLAERGHALLLDFGDGSHHQVPWQPGPAGLALLAVDTRVSHQLTDGGYAARRADCETAARALGVSLLRELRGRDEQLATLRDERVRRRARHVLSEMDRVDAVVDALGRGRIADIGPLLDLSHDSLRDDFEVSCPELDLVVDTCRSQGALGARMTGAGFGGSAIALLPTEAVHPAAAAVSAAFARRGWRAPRFLPAHAGDAARRLR